MKFSEIAQQDWEELKPYLDTCLLPLTGISADKAPWEVTQALESLRDLMDHIEIPFKGRVVTYPAFQYKLADEQLVAAVDAICRSLKADTFKFVILVTDNEAIAKLDFQACDLLISPSPQTEEMESIRSKIVATVQMLWK